MWVINIKLKNSCKEIEYVDVRSNSINSLLVSAIKLHFHRSKQTNFEKSQSIAAYCWIDTQSVFWFGWSWMENGQWISEFYSHKNKHTEKRIFFYESRFKWYFDFSLFLLDFIEYIVKLIVLCFGRFKLLNINLRNPVLCSNELFSKAERKFFREKQFPKWMIFSKRMKPAKT